MPYKCPECGQKRMVGRESIRCRVCSHKLRLAAEQKAKEQKPDE